MEDWLFPAAIYQNLSSLKTAKRPFRVLLGVEKGLIFLVDWKLSYFWETASHDFTSLGSIFACHRTREDDGFHFSLCEESREEGRTSCRELSLRHLEKNQFAVVCARLALINPCPQRMLPFVPRVTLTRSPASIYTLYIHHSPYLTPHTHQRNAVPDLPHLRRAHRSSARAPAKAVCVPAAAAKVPAGGDMPESARVLRLAQGAPRERRVGPHRPAQGRAERRGGAPRRRPHVRCDRGPWPRAGQEDEDEEARPCVPVPVPVCETGA